MGAVVVANALTVDPAGTETANAPLDSVHPANAFWPERSTYCLFATSVGLRGGFDVMFAPGPITKLPVRVPPDKGKNGPPLICDELIDPGGPELILFAADPGLSSATPDPAAV
ncbi:222R [Invertebrate iridescent virus Kaz2018]|uniref:222R n=1 Tax=Invertebrate iridescent virus 6 TaxID=176652 RepID=Q91FU9_IIV6|nr:222R [Invertebrate iridescent virus 6]AAK82084.1 222R [Invertebrate iridescent virus 6]QNH08632.1 222R [Invertebrate iridescent virus Kaz2018]